MWRVFCFSIAAIAAGCSTAAAASIYDQTNLSSDVPGLAANLDPQLQNPWGMSFGTSSPFWVSDQATNVSTLYTGTGAKLGLVVGTGAGPTGQVFNGSSQFQVSGTPAAFIFATLSGQIDAWNGGASVAAEFTATDGAVYTGLAIGTVGANNFLYAADANNGKIDVFNGSFGKTTLSGNFVDPDVTAGFTPYNVQTLDGKLYVTYSNGTSTGGFVGVFDLNGNFLQNISDPHLNSPWGLALAPAGFGSFAGDLLVGNLDQGTINGFDPVTGAFVGTLSDGSGPIVNDGLWALDFRAPGSGFDPNTLYFVAGINNQQDGLFGEIQATPEPATLCMTGLGLLAATLYRARRRTQA